MSEKSEKIESVIVAVCLIAGAVVYFAFQKAILGAILILGGVKLS